MSQTVKRKEFGEQAGEPSTYRVQRLKPPPKSEFHATLTQVFGGGMMGISKDGWKVIQQVMDFDYMGNAEYEFGAVPKALNNIVAERADYEAWSFVIKGSEVKLGWWRQRGFDTLRRAEIKAAKDKGEKPPRLTPKHKKALVEQAGAPIPDTTIYVVSHKQQGRDVVERLIRLIADDKIRTKGSPCFDLDREPGGYGSDFIGWFDLDNEVLWFRDKEVFDNFTKLFEIGQSEGKAA